MVFPDCEVCSAFRTSCYSSTKQSRSSFLTWKVADMLTRINKGEGVTGMRVVSMRGKAFNKGLYLSEVLVQGR